MKVFSLFRSALLISAVAVVPAGMHAQISLGISINIAPPVMPVYVQPECPAPNLMWAPGYWAYAAPDGYYWVPGTWVAAPQPGLLWTPGYWGYVNNRYAWNEGYWGPHVGYYGGVNYGFGYMGIGFVGGMWRGGVFAYNTAVMHVGVGGPWVGNRVYVDRTIVERNTIVNNNHVAFSGGPGGINHPPTPQERSYMREQHMAPTSVQTSHEGAAMHDKGAYAKNNGGHPTTLAVARPLTARPASGGAGGGQPSRSINYNASKSNTGNVNASRDAGGFSQGTEVHGNAQAAPAPRPAPTPRPAPEARPAPAGRPAPQSRPAPKNESHEKER